jgi:parallel beta-helix repeat protein
MRTLFVAAVSMIALSAASANAATYYVATSGNDANPGTIAAPFKTVSKAALVVVPGDVVNVRGGVYYERVRIPSKGTASARIVFQSYPGETAVIDGANVAADKATVHLTETEFVDFSGFEVRNSPFMGINMWYTKNTRVLNNHVHHARRNGIYAGADARGFSSDVTISGNIVRNTVEENQYHSMGTEGWAGAVVVSYTDRFTITSNKIYNNDGEGLIALRGDNALIQGNEIYDNYSVELYIDNARFVTVDRNLVYSTGDTRWYRDGYPAAGIAVANETNTIMNPSSDNTFTNNIVVGSRWGFYYGAWESGGGLRNTKVLNNTFYGTKQAVITIENDAHTNTIVQNNIFYSTGSPDPRYAGVGGVTYRNNLWYGGNAGAAAGTGDVYGNPRFANPGGLRADDYKLQAGSLALAAALDLSGSVSTDFFGGKRVTPFDIGAHQLSGGLTGDVTAPSVPLDLRPTTGTARSLTLVWSPATDNVGVTGYTVVRNGVAVATVQAPAWHDTSVTEGTQYSYQVQAIDAAGNRSALSAPLNIAWSSTPVGTGDTEAPSRPVNFRSTAATATSVALQWNTASDNVGVTNYEVYRDGVRIATPVRRSFTDKDLRAGTVYSYYVVAIDAAGNRSTQSATITVQTATARTRAARH